MTTTPMSPIKDILVVDDSRTELLFLRTLLSRNGYQVRTAENAEQAFQEMSHRLPDLILMDVVMPGTSGFQLTRSLARHPDFAHVPIFLCTSKNQETDRVWGLRQGARDYLTKPVDPELLLAKIAALRP
jgi:twitching motility two-component system response regulator PilH